ncbi:hypothetical protein BGZ58_000914 [Dissophora ornata]|nr:hypothetical protein BGZ58_000914 [Dissophora ornata]
MSGVNLLVQVAIQDMRINASIYWITECIDFKRSQQIKKASNSTASSSSSSISPERIQEIANYVFNAYLHADLSLLKPRPLIPYPSAAHLPLDQCLFTDHDPTTAESCNKCVFGQFSGGIILQVNAIEYIHKDYLKLIQACEVAGATGAFTFDAKGKHSSLGGMIALELSDGLASIRAIMREWITGITMDMKMGSKIRIRDVNFVRGALELTPTNTIFLGGEVSSLCHHNLSRQVPQVNSRSSSSSSSNSSANNSTSDINDS